VRGEPSRITVSESPSGTGLPHVGPIDGTLAMITASPTGGLTFEPDRITVDTGVYALGLRGGSNAQHTLNFADPSTLWSPLTVNTYGETKGGRIFFGKAGDYTFYCAMSGHRAAGMQGVVHVTGKPMTLEQAEAAATGFASS
jgi:plastocyanin